MQRRLVAVAHEPGVKVAGNAVVRAGISAVGRYVYFNHPVALDTVIFGSGRAYLGLLRQNDDAVVGSADTDFVFRANHTEAFYAAQLRALDGETFLAVVEFGSERGDDDLLSLRHVCRAADNLHGLFCTDIDAAHVHVVGIGVRLAGKHFGHHEALQPALNGLHFFHAAHFEADRSKRFRHLLCAEVEINVFFQPFIRYVHGLFVCLIC